MVELSLEKHVVSEITTSENRSKNKYHSCIRGDVIVVPWVSRVYGICTLRAVICIPEGAIHITARRVQTHTP